MWSICFSEDIWALKVIKCWQMRDKITDCATNFLQHFNIFQANNNSKHLITIMTDFKLISLNVRGLRSLNKRKAILMWLTKQKADVAFLQETYSSVEDEKFWNTQWKGKMLFSHAHIIVRVP